MLHTNPPPPPPPFPPNTHFRTHRNQSPAPPPPPSLPFSKAFFACHTFAFHYAPNSFAQPHFHPSSFLLLFPIDLIQPHTPPPPLLSVLASHYVQSAIMPPPHHPSSRPRRSGIFDRQSTRLRSNVADQVQRDLLPAGRMLSVFLILCELLAEVCVLIWSRGQSCDRPLRFWVFVLIMLQIGTVFLNCLNIWHGRDSFGQHRNGLSASELDMYTDQPATPVPHHQQHHSQISDSSIVVDVVMRTQRDSASESETLTRTQRDPASEFESLHGDTHQPLLDTPNPTTPDFPTQIPQSPPRTPLSPSPDSVSSSSYVSTDAVDRYVRYFNAWYLIWFILGSVWVSDGGTCSTNAPHLYRLIVALTIIYYALLFLPLACFCLIVCCLPLFILVYRIMLPYAERERRRARAADPAQVQSLNSIQFSPETFARHTGHDNLEDASCVICLGDYEEGEEVRFLPCKHHFHKECVDVWLRLDKACCLCKQDIDSQSAPTASPV